MYIARITIIALALTIMSAPVFAGKKTYVCHKSEEGSHVIKISKNALDAHLRHGDTEGKCPATPVYKTAVMIRCLNPIEEGAVEGAVVVSGTSVSDNAVLPEGLDLTVGASCSNAVARMMDSDYDLKQTSSGGTPLGLETEYLFIGESNDPAIEPVGL